MYRCFLYRCLWFFNGGGKVLCAMLVYLKGDMIFTPEEMAKVQLFLSYSSGKCVFTSRSAKDNTYYTVYAFFNQRRPKTGVWVLNPWWLFQLLFARTLQSQPSQWISDTVHPKSKFGRSYWGLPNSRHALCSWWSTCNNLQTQPRANEVHTWHLCQVSLVDQRKN